MIVADRRGFLPLLVCLLSATSLPAADPQGMQFFEQKIRPALVKHCYKCHSAEAKKPKGGLLLDTRDGLLKGGDTGPAVVVAKPVESLLIKALRHDGLEMPPSERLPESLVADFERWIQMGMPDPRDGKAPAAAQTIDIEAGRKFWAFQPPRHHPLPKVADAAWPRTFVDHFIRAAQESRGVRPVADADRATLLRRVTIDLIGLPPTPEEIDAFMKDESPEAYARVIDRLLTSPHFGERWGRHWLDVARYADSNGKDENLTFHDAYRYRDYVIDAFNRDKPFNRFIIEQLAGDLVPDEPSAGQDESLTGTGFLVVGPKVLADRDFPKRRMDVIDEQIDTIGKTFLGLTLGCARCHDHKFDPVPTADYYALAGILGSTRTLDGIKLGNAVVSGWMLRPLGGAEGEARLAAQKAHQKKVTAVADQIKKLQADLKQQEDKATMRVPGNLVGIVVDDKEARLVGQWKPSQFTRPYVGEGYIHDDKTGKGEKSATFTPNLPKAGEYEVFISYTASKGRAKNTPVTIRFDGGEKTVTVDQEQTPKLDGLFRSVGKFRFAAGSAGSVTISNEGTVGHVIVDAVRFVPLGALDKDSEMAMGIPTEVRQKIAEAQARLKDLQAEEAKLKAEAPSTPPLVMAVRDEPKIENARINIRGNPHSLGDEVPRGFLTVASKNPRPKLPSNQSGRLELAQWLADPGNPLTARVYVNRVWSHLFGEGLVRTVDNFGIQGEKPSHPELLDELALRFIAEGWSTKQLVRTLVLSRVYRLSSNAAGDDSPQRSPDAAAADPENRLLWRAHRRRVEAEVLRDAILQASGQMDRSMGGPVVSHLGERAIDNDSKGGVPTDASRRRSVYLPIIRNDIPQIFEVFDFADPEVTTGKRDVTTVSTQALYMMNSPFVLEQARLTARRLTASTAEDATRVGELYRRGLSRAPTPAEIERALRFLDDYRRTVRGSVASRPNEKLDPGEEAWTALCLAVFGCTEFRFVE